MKFENTEVFNIEGAMRGMRNPMNSWSRGDTERCIDISCEACSYREEDDCPDSSIIIGKNDMKLAQQLIRAGSEHRKFLRQIIVSVDITAPLYWYKEWDTYKVGTTANSTSTMHKLTSQPITIDCFEIEDYEPDLVICGCFTADKMWLDIIFNLEMLRREYVATKDKRYWKELIRILPESWLQTRTITLNYENIYSMIRQREHHKLTEWSESFIEWCKTLPYSKELLFLDLKESDGTLYQTGKEISKTEPEELSIVKF